MTTVISRALASAEATLSNSFALCESSHNKRIAQTIISQLKATGGWALASWGANEFIALEKGLQFKVRGKNAMAGGRVQIHLNTTDTYDVRLIRVRGSTVKEIGSTDHVYFDQLVDVLDDLIDG